MANKAIFFDRDDTLIEDPGYINNPDQVKLLEGVPEALIELKAMGYKLVIASNQSGVARGIVTEDVLGQIHKRLEELLGEKGASIDGIYYCPYHPDGVIPKYRRTSEMRKPSPGMLLEAAKDMEIDLNESWAVGNGPGDIEAGSRAGCRTILLESRGHEQKVQPGRIVPDYRAVNLKEVINIIKMHARGRKPTVEAAPVVEPKPQTVEELKPPVLPRGEPEPPPQAAAKQEAAKKNDEEPTTNQLLKDILDQLKLAHRTSMFGEFYINRFVAGIVQGLVFLCLFLSVYFLLGPAGRLNAVLISLGFAILFQLMAMTFYIMQGPK
ncbi:MAG: HAD-IIIA family hydrolase [Sedimentisphaerales bacterium]|nr:HAD-IIIA family hydrolase [Sedimentisphaerales bacterium]